MPIQNLHDFKKHFQNKSKWERKSLIELSNHAIYQDILTTPNDGGQQAYDLSKRQEVKLHLLPRLDVPKASFIADADKPYIYYAHPTTLKALRKDIFCVGDDFDTYEEIHQCDECHKNFDIQFYLLCPYCGNKINVEKAKAKIKQETL